MRMTLVDPSHLIRSGNFFCQECCHDFDAPAEGQYCPRCGAERISEDCAPSQEVQK